ncbi:MAG: heparinase II/III family protein [Phycisphaerales bacterium]|nr:heparinase II/III family protein [Phycisphaerales bacterium]
MVALIQHVCLLLAITLMHVSARSVVAEPSIPTAEQIISLLHDDHPRLLVRPGDFDALRERIDADPTLRSWCDHIQRRADKILDAEPSKYEIPDGKRLLATSRRVLDRTYTLALTYHMRGRDARYRDRLWAELEAAAKFKDWNPSHFLDTAEMTHAFAIAYDWLYDDWTDAQRDVIRSAIITHGLEPSLRCYQGKTRYGWWVKTSNNWNQVCNGGIAMGALAIADEQPELASAIIHAGLRSLPIAMRRFAPDGASIEGPGYWHYATSYNVIHLAALDTALGTDFGFSDFTGFDHAGDFVIAMTGPIERTFNFADGGSGAVRAPQLFWMAKKFDHPRYASYQLQHAQPTPLDLMWYRKPERDPQQPPLDAYFRGVEVVTMRSAWDDTDALFVGFKAGDNKASHAHLDLGSFVLDALGKRWALDLGGDNYNLPAYFGSKRWTYYRLRTEGHNAIVVNPGQQPSQDPTAHAKIITFRSTDMSSLAIADLTSAYRAHVKRAHRGIALVNDRAAVLLQDEIEAKKPADIWWFMHTKAAVEIDETGTYAILRAGDDRLRVDILQPENARFTVMDARPLPTSPNPDGQNGNAGVRKLTIHLTDVEQLKLAVLFTPLRNDATELPRKPELKPLSEW